MSQIPDINDPKQIPANPNPIENGLTDPTPQPDNPHGSLWRAAISWLKGWRRNP